MVFGFYFIFHLCVYTHTYVRTIDAFCTCYERFLRLCERIVSAFHYSVM